MYRTRCRGAREGAPDRHDVMKLQRVLTELAHDLSSALEERAREVHQGSLVLGPRRRGGGGEGVIDASGVEWERKLVWSCDVERE